MLAIGQQVEIEIEGRTYRVVVESLAGEEAAVTVDGRSYRVRIAAPAAMPASAPAPALPTSMPLASPAPPARALSAAGSLCASMPGVVMRVLVSAGQPATVGQVLLVLEAMKMENEIRTNRAGTIAKVHVQPGQKVQTGDPLVSFA